MGPVKSLLSLMIAALSVAGPLTAQDDELYQVGFSKVDITPDYPVRLNGFGNRREEFDGVSQPLFARAMAISQGDGHPLVMVAIDNLGVRMPHVDEVARRLKDSDNLPRQNLAVTFTHSHCAPKVSGASDNIFSQSIPAAQQTRIDRYTGDLVDAMTTAARQAIQSRRSSTLRWSIGDVGFAKNRRREGGPVDHDLPALIVRDAETETVRGVYVSYACHCVTLRFNKISGDWAGYAAETIERQFPGAIALVSIGAGSDQNPTEVTPDDIRIAQRQGLEIAAVVQQLSGQKQKRVRGIPRATLQRIELPLNQLPTREQLTEIAQKGARPTDRYNAATQLAKLDRDEALLSAIDYPIQTWSFGDSLCITFLAGEVCVDYALRLKQEFDRGRFWLNAYSNDFCSYIPSERLAKEGGYGGGAEVPYFALPATLAAGLEQKIVDQVHRQVPPSFLVPQGVNGIAPKSPADSLDCMRTHDHLRIRIAAAEPLVCDPVAIEFGIDGCVWVAEMADYGRGVYEPFDATGRVRCLRDQNGDGKLDHAVTFKEGLRFPTDVKIWRDGLLICDAPDILWARDTDGDGAADETITLFSGFEVQNAQARVNGLRLGLDHWIHGSCGLFGGQILSHKTGEITNLVGRDFRMNPDTGEIEAVAGRTQQGRCRNDWGDWFGCSNGALLRHYSSQHRYAGRNRFAAAPATADLTGDASAYQMYPPENLVRFELSGTPGRATSACGLGIYRDVRLGNEYFGSALTCEPVHQLVHRIKLTSDGLGYRAQRGEGESQSEFLSSTDRWFRPVQARTGPDGALWVVDMYRYVIEHPRWIPQSTLAQLDVFAGHQLGRLYRVTAPSDDGQGHMDLSEKSNHELAELLRRPNGTLRDLAHQLLIWRGASDAVPTLVTIANQAALPQAKIQALAVLDALNALESQQLLVAMQDEHAEVVRHAVRLSEPMLDQSDALRKSVLRLSAHASPRVRRQVAWSLGETSHDDAVAALAALASKKESNPHVRAAVISSIHQDNASQLLREYAKLPTAQQVPMLLRGMTKSAIRLGTIDQGKESLRLLVSRDRAALEEIAEALDAVDARIGDADVKFGSGLRVRVRQIHEQALNDLNLASLALLGRHRGRVMELLLQAESGSSLSTETITRLIADLIAAKRPVQIQSAAIEALSRTRNREVARLLLDRYHQVSVSSQQAILDALLSRKEWASTMLDRIASGDLRANVLDADRRGQLLSHSDPLLRARAGEVLGMNSPAREEILKAYQPSLQLTGDADRGRERFRKHCSACHKLEGQGHVVGPDLQALTNRDPQWLLTAIMDPNRDVDARYVAWKALSDDGRVISGLVVDESASTITLRESGGKEHVLLREEIEHFRASDVSLMPEGLEKEMTGQDVSDLIAYVIRSISPALSEAPTTALPRYPPGITPYLLDESQSTERRQSVIDLRPGMGPAIVGLLVKDFRPGNNDQQYQRMPWIWRVSLAVGRRNDGGEIRDLLEQSLPAGNDPLQHWQAVAVGGGIINGLTQVGQWPGRRIAEILKGTESLRPRWQHALKLAAAMADDSQVRAGTRYDALRIIALSGSPAIAQLKRYLVKDADRQLQMGAVSGLADIEMAEVTGPLLESLSFLSGRNRQLAIEGLLRNRHRSDALQRAAANNPDLIQIDELTSMLDHTNKDTQTNAARVLETVSAATHSRP